MVSIKGYAFFPNMTIEVASNDGVSQEWIKLSVLNKLGKKMQLGVWDTVSPSVGSVGDQGAKS